MSELLLIIGLFLLTVAWIVAAIDAFNQKQVWGLILLLCPAIYWTYALAFLPRRAALVSLALTLLAGVAFVAGMSQ